jgi:transmembrane sensor
MSRADRIEGEAADWLVRQEGEIWSSEDEAGLEAWLTADVLHEVTYYRLEHGWRSADRLVALRTPERTIVVRTGRFWRPVAIAASLLVVCLAGVLGYGLVDRGGPETYATLVGGHSAIPLADGSQVELNTDTAIAADIDTKVRKVVLTKGEAFFDIAHDATRPFEVVVGNHRVIVVGTKFSVKRIGGDIQVNVLEGRVKIIPIKAATEGSALREMKMLSAGEIAMISGSAELVTSRSHERVVESLSWREGVLLFDQDTIGDAAAEFNRYNIKKIVVRDPQVRVATISGRFQAGNVDAFTRLLGRAYGFEIRQTADGVEILQ